MYILQIFILQLEFFAQFISIVHIIWSAKKYAKIVLR